MNDQPSKNDVRMRTFLLIAISLAMLWTLVSENLAIENDPSQWFHWAICYIGVIIAMACASKWFFSILMGCLYNPHETGLFDLGFKNSTRLINWTLGFALGMFIMVYEFRIESDWLIGHI